MALCRLMDLSPIQERGIRHLAHLRLTAIERITIPTDTPANRGTPCNLHVDDPTPWLGNSPSILSVAGMSFRADISSNQIQRKQLSCALNKI